MKYTFILVSVLELDLRSDGHLCFRAGKYCLRSKKHADSEGNFYFSSADFRVNFSGTFCIPDTSLDRKLQMRTVKSASQSPVVAFISQWESDSREIDS